MQTGLIQARIRRSIELKQSVLANVALLELVETAARWCTEAFRNKKKVLWCGNGGSAADAQHLSAEFSGRFYYDRPPLYSEALHVNTSYITAVGNDYGYDQIYERLVRAKVAPGDIVIAMSTSGNSMNVVKALRATREIGGKTIGFTGEGGGELAKYCDLLLNMPSTDTPRIQELHMLLGHCICEIVETELFPKT